VTIIRPPGNQPAGGGVEKPFFPLVHLLGVRQGQHRLPLTGNGGLGRWVLRSHLFAFCLIVIAHASSHRSGWPRNQCVSFLEAFASGWFGLVMLRVSSGGLSDGWVSGWSVRVEESHKHRDHDVGINGFNRPVLKHGPRSLTCVRVLRVAKTPDAQWKQTQVGSLFFISIYFLFK